MHKIIITNSVVFFIQQVQISFENRKLRHVSSVNMNPGKTAILSDKLFVSLCTALYQILIQLNPNFA